MAPRARTRKRSTRMDAAVDAMGNLGFDADVVTRVVRELLDIYGGDEAWPFIEEYGYKELIDAVLRDSETSKDENLEQVCSGAGDFAPEVENSIVVKSPSSSVVCANVTSTGYQVSLFSCLFLLHQEL
ncbi:unnamed protein product [Cuscuta campestris]|uniref:WIYLD domain-containing protein n=1 Tax=Cuscuta campestris TaxID=132261 RepID=A0A484LNA2_9ASTE|nr:unnamed protein product [Cuscuta campestris]